MCYIREQAEAAGSTNRTKQNENDWNDGVSIRYDANTLLHQLQGLSAWYTIKYTTRVQKYT